MNYQCQSVLSVSQGNICPLVFRQKTGQNFIFLWDEPIKIGNISIKGLILSTLRSGNGNAAAAEDESHYWRQQDSADKTTWTVFQG